MRNEVKEYQQGTSSKHTYNIETSETSEIQFNKLNP